MWQSHRHILDLQIPPRGSIAETHGYGMNDALVVATALEAGCETLYSEDFQDGQTIDGQVTIRNPFAS